MLQYPKTPGQTSLHLCTAGDPRGKYSSVSPSMATPGYCCGAWPYLGIPQGTETGGYRGGEQDIGCGKPNSFRCWGCNCAWTLRYTHTHTLCLSLSLTYISKASYLRGLMQDPNTFLSLIFFLAVNTTAYHLEFALSLKIKLW